MWLTLDPEEFIILVLSTSRGAHTVVATSPYGGKKRMGVLAKAMHPRVDSCPRMKHETRAAVFDPDPVRLFGLISSFSRPQWLRHS